MTKNTAASVRARLANHARESRRPFQEVLQYYGLERFLYRLSRTEHRSRFIRSTPSRPRTRATNAVLASV